MITSPKVSIIIPCHNYGTMLTETLESLLEQTLKDWEAWIIDDGSTDKTRDVANKFCTQDARFNYVYQEKSGVSAARNNGLQQARGHYIQFLDADDLISAEKLKIQTALMDAHPEIGVTYSASYYFETNKKELVFKSFQLTNDEWMEKLDISGQELIKILVEKNLFVISSPLIRLPQKPAELAKFKEKLAVYEDWLYWVTLATQGARFTYIENEDCFTLIRVHRSSTVQDKKKMFEGHAPFLKEVIKTLETSNLPNKEKSELIRSCKQKTQRWCKKKIRSSPTRISLLKETAQEAGWWPTLIALARTGLKLNSNPYE